MKGLQHSVIEIKDTQNSEIEKILVFLRPGEHKIDVDSTRKEAQEILQKVNIRKKVPTFAAYPRLLAVVVAMITAIVSLLFVIF